MKVFAVKCDRPCKNCGKNHGYFTSKHRVLVASAENKYLLEPLIKFGSIVEVEDKTLVLPTIDVAEFFMAAKR